MYLKSLTLKGFLSYKEATTVYFHPGFNVIVGPNGSGKSSLLSGIRFILGSSDGSADRRTYLHQGRSSRAVRGYVEAVLDNSDGQAAGIASAGELVIRRDIGLKTDDITLNGKKVTHKDLNNVLESAGFPRTNPYYLVYQHEVTSLARVTPAERYAVLKDVAGTQTYDGRRAEALANLQRSNERRQEVEVSLDLINQRVAEMREEQRQLEHYALADKERLCIESLLDSRRIAGIDAQISACQQILRGSELRRRELDEEELALQEKLQTADEAKVAVEIALERAQAALKATESSLGAQAGDRARVQADLEALREKIAAAEQERKQLTKRRDELGKKQREYSERIRTELLPKYEAAQTKDREASASLETCRAAVTALASSTGATSGTTKAARKKALAALVKEKEKEVKQLEKVDREHGDKVGQLEMEQQSVQREVAKLKEKINSLKSASVGLDRQGTANELHRLQEEDRRLRDRILEQRNVADRASEALKNAQRKLRRTVRPQVSLAHDALMEWAKKEGYLTSGDVLGPLINLIEVDKENWVAVERAAGNEIFNFLVKNREIARKAIEYVKKACPNGSTTITPLEDAENLLPPKPNLRLPANNTRIRHLTSTIKSHGKTDIAVRQVFGRYLLVPNIEDARKWMDNGVDCITLEGSIVSRNGVVSGGFHGALTRLCTAHEIRARQAETDAAESEIKACLDRLQSITSEVQTLEERRFTVSATSREAKIALLDATGALEVASQRLVDIELALNDARFASSAAAQELQNAKQALTTMQEEVANLHQHADSTQETAERYEALTTQLVALTAEAETASTAAQIARTALADAQRQLCDIETESTALNREQEEQEQDVGITRAAQVSTLQEEFERCNAVIADLEKRLKAEKDAKRVASKAVAAEKAQQKALNQQLDEVKVGKEKLGADIELETAKLAKLRAARGDRVTQGVAGGSELLQQLETLSDDALMRRHADLQKLLEESGALSTQAAATNMAGILEDVENLTKQRRELAESENAVRQLMETFDQQKANTLLQTFDNVNRSFSAIFSQIVKGGEAQLVLKRRPVEQLAAHADAMGDDDSRIMAASTGVPSASEEPPDPFVGVTITVRFPGQNRRTLPLESLSGGQKSVAALALIFAMQQVDSAPLFVFDEVDAALDDSYRTAVANIIKTQAKDRQMIAISHRPQLVGVGEHFLSTTIIDQESYVSVVSVDEALAISQRQQVAEGTSLPAPNDENVLATPMLQQLLP